jgi:maltose O-acetyltransferase
MKPPSGQKAKMLAGELYLATDPELVAADLRAQELLFLFNTTRPGTDRERRALLVELFDMFATGAVLRPSFRCDYGSNISIGEETFINYDCVFLDCKPDYHWARSPNRAPGPDLHRHSSS